MSKLQEFLQGHNIEVSEETVQKLNEMITSYGQTILEEANTQHEDEIAYLKEMANEYGESIFEIVNEQAEYAAQKFIEENKERLVETEQFKRMQGAFEAVLEAFESHGFNVNKNAAIDKAQALVEERSKAYDELFEEMKSLKSDLQSAQRQIVFMERTRDLAETQIEAAKNLLESVEFNSQEEFQQGLDLIIESVTRPAEPDTSDNVQVVETLTEEVVAPATKQVDPQVAKYLSAMRTHRR